MPKRPSRPWKRSWSQESIQAPGCGRCGVWRKIYQLAQELGVPVRPQNFDTRRVAGEWRRNASARKRG
jgi:hypothetical protein